MSFLSFLKSAKVEEVTESVKRGPGGAKKDWNPAPAILAIRLWKDGSVFPSQAVVDKFDLEYRGGSYEVTPATAAVGTEGTEGYVAAKPKKKKFVYSGDAGNAFDVIDSTKWGAFKGEGHMLFIGVVPKTAPRVDLFGTTTWDDAGKPKSSVLDQGSNSFGKEVLLEAVESIYGITFHKPGKEDSPEVEGVDFVDLEIIDEAEGIKIGEVFGKPIIYAPKRIIRGKDAGQYNYERRENMPLFGLVPSELLHPTGGTAIPPAEPEEVEGVDDTTADAEKQADISA